MIRWGVQWVSKNLIKPRLLGKDGIPLLFRTKAEARLWSQEHYAYIRTRKDLRTSPHNWRMPNPVKVKIEAIP